MPTTARLRLLLATACITLAAATPADAALIQQVYRGTITSGYDIIGLFGAGQDLTGLAYTATYLIDDSKGFEIRSSDDDGSGSYSYSTNQIYGGTAYNGASNPVSAKLTIAGVTIGIGGSDYGYGYKSDHNPAYYSGITDSISTTIYNYRYNPDGSQTGYDSLYSYVAADSATITSSDLRAADAFTVPPGSSYAWSSYNRADYVTGNQVFAQFDVTSFASGPAAVPEPASWALMIGGFGIAGGALRRRAARGTARPATALA